MELNNNISSEKTFRRDKWCYSVGGVGRDMSYTLVASFLMIYIQYTMNLTPVQFAAITVILVIGRVWDAINDPMMGAIIENTRSRFGKFKPWILIGAVLTAIVNIIMFTVRPAGWNFVVFFGVIYLIWEIAFTMNDISYWSMLPSLSSNPKRRNSVTTLAVVFAGVGAFAANAVITFSTVGNAIEGYKNIAIFIAFILVACQSLTVFGVKQQIVVESEENVSLKKMFKVIKNNDQLLWNVLAMLLYNIGSNLLVVLGYNFIYLEIGYDSTQTLIFIASFGISNIGIQAFYSVLANKFGRKKLLIYSLLCLVFGYVILLLVGFVPFLPMHIISIVIFGFFVFGGQAIFYMVLTVNITNTVEYNEYKTGERNESVIFSLRPFMAKMASALEQGVVYLVLILSGVYLLSQNVSELENQKFLFDKMTPEQQEVYRYNAEQGIVIFDGEKYDGLSEEDIDHLYEHVRVALEDTGDKNTLEIKHAADVAFKNNASIKMRVILRFAITILPILLISISYLILKKKFIIDETMYDKMVREIKERRVV